MVELAEPLGFPNDLVVHDAVLIRRRHQDLVREVLAEGEVEDEVAFGLAGEDADVAQLQGLQEDSAGELALVRDAENLLQMLVLERVAVKAEVLVGARAFLIQLFVDLLAETLSNLGSKGK